MKHALLLTPLLVLAACAGEPTSTVDNANHPLAPLYLEQAPSDAVEVSALRELESGASVVVRGYVQNFAPVAGMAVLSLYDHALLSCDERPDDACQTPWDFCCVSAEKIARNNAMVEFRQGEELIVADLAGFHGIDYLSDVVVTGTLQLDDAGNARILADGLHVE